MKHHRFYKERIASFLTTFELNPSSISQRWIENKFYSMDEERLHIFRHRFIKENARISISGKSKQNYSYDKPKFPSPSTLTTKSLRCKYCYLLGHTDNICRKKQMKQPPSMPDWVSKTTCRKCKKKGHLSFNCPPKYDNKPYKSTKNKSGK